MSRKPFTLRQATLTGAALLAGSTAGATVDSVLVPYFPVVPHSLTQLAAAATALWVLDKLNKLIDDGS